MKSTAEKTSEHRASADVSTGKGTAQFFAPAPVMQLQLDENGTYKALKGIKAFSSSKKQNTDTRLTAGNVYTVKRVFGVKNKAELFEHNTEQLFYIPDGKDASFQKIVKLDDTNQQLLEDKPQEFEFMDFYDDSYVPQTPQMNTVTEGEIGDCWLIGPMLALARSNRKDDLKSGIGVDKMNKKFGVRTFDYDDSVLPGNAMPNSTLSVVDGTFPIVPSTETKTGNRENLYSQLNLSLPDQFDKDPSNTQLIPALYEKALAQERGGYQALDDRSAKEGFAVLSGVMPYSMDVKTTKLTKPGLTDLKNELDTGGAITMTTIKNSDGPPNPMCTDPGMYPLDSKSKNLVEDHVYMVYEITSTVVKLHNPHGSDHPMDLNLKAINDYISLIDLVRKK